MNEQEVIEYIGEDNFAGFIEFMYGQTVGLNKDGSTNYYKSDVERYKIRLRKLELKYNKMYL